MSETVDRIINDHLKQRPGARHAYSHDATMHNDIERARNMLAVMEAAMQREGIPYDSTERVLNEVVHVGLDGWEREKLSRERALLLSPFDTSEFGFPSDSGSFAALAEHVNRADPERPAGSEETTT